MVVWSPSALPRNSSGSGLGEESSGSDSGEQRAGGERATPPRRYETRRRKSWVRVKEPGSPSRDELGREMVKTLREVAQAQKEIAKTQAEQREPSKANETVGASALAPPLAEEPAMAHGRSSPLSSSRRFQSSRTRTLTWRGTCGNSEPLSIATLSRGRPESNLMISWYSSRRPGHRVLRV